MRHARTRQNQSSSPTSVDWPPVTLSPMLATASQTLPRESPRLPGWGYEFKWDGIRSLGVWDGRVMRLISRNGLDLTGQYPEISAKDGLGAALGPRQRVVLDGELIAPDEDGRPSFERLQRRMNLHAARVSPQVRRAVPVVYMMFDVLCLGEETVIGLPYAERRERLEALGLGGDYWRIPEWRAGEGEAMLRAANRVGLEGVIAKRLDSPYRPGERSRDWLKVKIRRQQEFVVVGWTEMRGVAGQLGSLLVGYREPDAAARRQGGWRLAGQVGSGLGEEDRTTLRAVLERFERVETVVSDPLPVRRERVHHVEPVLVVEVAFQEWTHGGGLRQPVYRGIRIDKDAREVVKEETSGGGA